MSKRPIYLDYAATTPVDPRVVDAMVPWLYENFGNPASRSHAYGWDAEEAVEQARAHVAALVNADAKDIIWTSGATESNNLAIKGAAAALAHQGKHVVTVATEHKAVLDPCHELERQGFEVTFLPVLSNGLLDLDQFRASLRDDTILVSVMLVNNEIGVIQDIAAIAAICHEKGILLHVDAAQATGKVAIDLQAIDVGLMSFCAHKTYGPKGIGALYVRRRPKVRVLAQLHGGGHERGFRSGTLATHQIVGMGEAFRLAKLEMAEDMQRMAVLGARLREGLLCLPDVYLNGDAQQRVANNLNISVDHIEGEALVMSLPEIATSSGSACTSASLEPSYVLKAIGRTDALAHSSLRLSIGRFTTTADIDAALTLIPREINRLRELSPFWEDSRQAAGVA